jgi:DNA-binding MarR family transcriptional regulator
VTTGDVPDMVDVLRLINLVGYPPRARALLALLDYDGLRAAELVPEVALAKSASSRQVALLSRAGMITSRRDNKGIRYSLTEDGVRLARIVVKLAEVGE